MSNVYFPAQVVVLFRRIAGVVTGLSSQHAFKHTQGSAQTVESSRKSALNDGLRADGAEGRPDLRSFSSLNDRQSQSQQSSHSFASAGSNNHVSTSPPPQRQETQPQDKIHQLLASPVLYDPLRVPRHPIVLCHGLYGFDTRGPSSFPSMRMHYWSNVLNILRGTLGAEVIITSVPGTGSIASRAEHLDRQLREKAMGKQVNLMAHSMGGLDGRHLITHCKPEEYTPVSLTTISTPHRGSPFMDWCSDYLGLGRLVDGEKPHSSKEDAKAEKEKRDRFSALSLSSLPSSFTTSIMSIVDSPAYANLTSKYLQDVFNPATPDDPNVKYLSVAGRMPDVSIWHPFWLPKMVLDDFERKSRQSSKDKWEGDSRRDMQQPLWAKGEEWGNDGLVTIQSAKWGEFLGTMEGCDHWELRGARGIEFGVDLPAIPAIGLGTTPAPTGDGDLSSEGNDEKNSGEKDWSWILKAWRREEKIQEEASKSKASMPSSEQDREKERKTRKEQDEAIIKASTDKVSVVFDWLTERVPTPPLPVLGGKRASSEETRAFDDKEYSSQLDSKEGRKGKRNDLSTKADLERFYIALSRKIYDEGL